MVVDVIQVTTATSASQLRKVMQFVCGNALVCETIKEARYLAFGRQERLKVNYNHKSTMFTNFISFAIAVAPLKQTIQTSINQMCFF